MRDIIWTIIVIWLVYKLVDIFRGSGQKKKYVYNQESQQHHANQTTFDKSDTKSATQKRADTEGEYVDFEEMP